MIGLRLLLVTDSVGGVWVYSLELARALQQRGIETLLAVVGPSANQLQREQAAGIRMFDTGLPLDWLETNPGELRRAGETLAQIAARECVDVVQTCSAALLADAQFEQPTVAVQHSCVASWWTAVKGTPLPTDFEWRRELVECGLRRAAAVVAPSIAFAAETARIYDVNALAVHNGLRPRVAPFIAQGDFVFTAGRLWDEGKNAATLDAAAARMDVPFQVAGPTRGPNGARIHFESARAIGELSSTRLSGVLAARPVYASAALYEPFGLSVLEAAQAGCALVLSDIPTHRELWGDAAIFVSPRDHQGFAAAIQGLFDDPDERQRRGRTAQVCAANYAPEPMAGAMAGIYSRLVSRTDEPVQLAGAA